ncbi:MAG: ASCH domain-containing protein [Victivallaceae bacterium]|nr:ASCH domain-containing protein [Victivallaceae bacterium]
MKVLSVQQPWAWAIIEGFKDIENRSWQTSYRGGLLIHAGKKFDLAGYDWIRDNFPMVPMPANKGDFYFGGLIGMVDLLDIVKNDPSRWAEAEYFNWKLGAPERLPFMPCRGKLNLFEEPTCRVCGCTSYHACLDGCYWVEPDLCSACV